jgi:L-ascorbate metabolism protein UlaG (beta-lactamase superfamily)
MNTPLSKPKAHFLGHSTILIETIENKKILIDPFLSQNPTYPKDFSPLPLSDIDYIVLTHGHSDHTADVIETAKASNAKVAATYELAMLVQKFSGAEIEVLPMNKGGTIALPDSKIELSLTHAYHSSSFDAPDGNTYYAGEACGVIITLENGKNIYHAGDTCFFSEMNHIRESFQPDIGFLPIGDCFTMGPEEAAKSAITLGLRKAIPVHWGTFPPLTGTPESFKEACSGRDMEVCILQPGAFIEL